jgi:hypothetical protein
MASFFDSRIFSQLAGTAGEVARERARTYDQQFRKSGADALEAGQQLLGLFEQLPAAMITSERNEYERLVKRYGVDHPRAAQVRETITELEGFGSQMALGRARVTRALESMRTPGVAFFGFVHDESGEPLHGLTVRISESGRSEPLESRTAEDGYFRIPLVQEPRRPAAARKRASARRAEASAAAGQPEERAESATVEILDERGTIVHVDPVPLNLGAEAATGADSDRTEWVRLSESIYREYRIERAEKKPRPTERPRPARKR